MKWLSTSLESAAFFFAVLFAVAVVVFLSALIEVYEITVPSLPEYEQSGKYWFRKKLLGLHNNHPVRDVILNR